MALTIPKSNKSEFELVPVGNHVAVCVGIIDLGSRMKSYENKPERLVREVRIVWEIAEEVRNDGNPHTIGKTYNYSGNEKSTFRKDLESWRGAKFTEEEIGNFRISNLLNKACMLNVVHQEKGDKTYDNIISIAKIPKGVSSPLPKTEPLFFSLESDEYSADAFGLVPEWMQKSIQDSPEWLKLAATVGVGVDGGEEEIPF